MAIVKIVKVEVNSTQYGTKKHLTADNGEVYKIGEKNRCYNAVTQTGDYDITFGTFQGKPFVQNIKLVGANSSGAAPSAAKTLNAKSNYMDSKEKLEFEKMKQNEIKIECYAGIAKDILIHNAAIKGVAVDAGNVLETAYELIRGHKAVLDILSGKNKEIHNEAKQPENANEDASI